MKQLTFTTVMLAATLAHAAPFPSQNIQGSVYESACSPAIWQDLRGDIADAAQGRNPDGLTTLIRTWLCGSGPRADQFVRQNTKAKLATSSEQTGIEGREYGHQDRSAVSALGGSAWSVGIQRQERSVIVSFFPNEACATSASFALRRGQWRLESLDEACD